MTTPIRTVVERIAEVMPGRCSLFVNLETDAEVHEVFGALLEARGIRPTWTRAPHAKANEDRVWLRAGARRARGCSLMSPHWRAMTDRQGPWLYAEHLPRDRDVVVVIERVVLGEVIGEKGRKTKKPVIHFRGKSRPLALNATNAKTISGLYGPMTEAWPGKSIALYVTTTKDAHDEVVDCIRVRPKVPRGAADTSPEQELPGPETTDAG
jgi:hypothetical protein